MVRAQVIKNFLVKFLLETFFFKEEEDERMEEEIRRKKNPSDDRGSKREREREKREEEKKVRWKGEGGRERIGWPHGVTICARKSVPVTFGTEVGDRENFCRNRYIERRRAMSITRSPDANQCPIKRKMPTHGVRTRSVR